MNFIAKYLSLAMLATSQTTATPVARPEPALLERLDQLNAPAGNEVAPLRSQAEKSIGNSAQRSAAADAQIQSFAQQTGHPLLVAQSDNQTTTKADNTASPASTPGAKEAKPAKPKQADTTIKVE